MMSLWQLVLLTVYPETIKNSEHHLLDINAALKIRVGQRSNTINLQPLPANV